MCFLLVDLVLILLSCRCFFPDHGEMNAYRKNEPMNRPYVPYENCSVCILIWDGIFVSYGKAPSNWTLVSCIFSWIIAWETSFTSISNFFQSRNKQSSEGFIPQFNRFFGCFRKHIHLILISSFESRICSFLLVSRALGVLQHEGENTYGSGGSLINSYSFE